MHIETKWKTFPNGSRRIRKALTDKLSGQVKEIGSVELKKNALYDEEDEQFDDHIDNQGNIPKLSDFPLKTDVELMDTSGTRW